MTRTSYLIFSEFSGDVIRRCHTEETAQRYLDQQWRAVNRHNRSHQKTTGTGYHVCPPGEEIVWGNRYGNFVRSGMLNPSSDGEVLECL